MLSTQNHHYRLEGRQPLPWGDPYIVQLFTTSSAVEHVNPWHGSHPSEYTPLRLEAVPPLGDPSPDFEISRRATTIAPQEEPANGE